jgi:hypothetical protein
MEPFDEHTMAAWAVQNMLSGLSDNPRQMMEPPQGVFRAGAPPRPQLDYMTMPF